MKYSWLVVALGVFIAACGGNSASPTSPSPGAPGTLPSMTGTWSGTSTDSTGQEQMIWTVTQSGTTVNGTMGMTDTGRGMMGNGTMTGTINGDTFTFQMGVPNGGFSGVMSPCSMAITGQATISADGHTMTGTYAGDINGMMSGGMMNQSCGGAVNGGRFTLTR